MLNATDDVTEAPEYDAIDLLMADHKQVKHLFAQFDALKDTGSDDEKLRVVQQICQALTIHTALEEEIFYPAVRQQIDDEDLMDEALIEHAGAKHLIAQLRSADPSDDLYAAKVTVLGEQIDHHVIEEEGSMFPQARFVNVDTRELAERMQARKVELLEQGDLGPPPDITGSRADKLEASEVAASRIADVTPIRAAGAPVEKRSVKRPARGTKQAVKKKPQQTARKRS